MLIIYDRWARYCWQRERESWRRSSHDATRALCVPTPALRSHNYRSKQSRRITAALLPTCLESPSVFSGGVEWRFTDNSKIDIYTWTRRTSSPTVMRITSENQCHRDGTLAGSVSNEEEFSILTPNPRAGVTDLTTTRPWPVGVCVPIRSSSSFLAAYWLTY